METDYFYIDSCPSDNRIFVLVIYDIVDDRRRRKLVKFLMGYGFRIQKSAFEAVIKVSLYRKMLSEIGQYAAEEDNIRVYRIMDRQHVQNFGKSVWEMDDEVIIV